MSEINSIQSLRSVPFSRRTFEEKKNIISSGRPTPEVVITKTTKNFVRHFQASTYDKHKWLAGYPQVCKLFCWPSLLFSTEHTVWTTTGYGDLNNLHTAMSKHERASPHILCMVKLQTFGNTRIDHQLNEGLRLEWGTATEYFRFQLAFTYTVNSNTLLLITWGKCESVYQNRADIVVKIHTMCFY